MHLPSYISGKIYIQAARTLRSRVSGVLEKYGLSTTAWALMGVVLASRDGIRLNETAAILDVKAPLVTMIADELIDRGYMNRLPHQVDRRAKLLVITPKGKAFMKRVEEEVNEHLLELLEGIDEKDLEAYRRVLEAIIENGKVK